ncbi:JmjC domain-containing histone demethylation protein 1 [Ceratobasidium sp. 428]|nr:JmjC domain-containing histone demethylation protein 1 [Ceratobasidium sp. 428]
MDTLCELRVRDIEITTRVPKKFRFPFFTKICWYVAEKYVRDLKAKEEFPPRVLDGLASLATFLVGEARSIERGTGKEAREHVPGDRIKEPGALARELRWRVRNARGVDSDGEGGPSHVPPPTHNTGVKRKRTEEPIVENGGGAKANGSTNAPAKEPTPLKAETPPMQPVAFRNFTPRAWVEIRRDSAVSTSWVAADSIPEDGEASETKLVAEDAEGAAELQTRVDTIVKTRQVQDGESKVRFERQTIMRTLDVYVWDSNAVASSGDIKTESSQAGTPNDTSISMPDISMCAPDVQLLNSSSSSVDPASAPADVSM